MKSALVAAMLLLWGLAARADEAVDFYRGKTLTLTVGFNTGGAYDVYARLFARHFPRFLVDDPEAAAPNVIVRNMPGAGSVIAANYLFNRAAADGAEFGLIAGDAALAPLFGGTASQFDSQKFTWLGSANREVGACFAWHTSGIASAGELFTRGMVTGTAGTSSLLVPTMLNQALGARLKLVRGYAGTSALMLAIERGEVEGMCGMVLAALQTEHPDWLRGGLIKPLLQIGLEPHPDFAGVPMVTEFSRDAETTQLLRLLIGWTIMGRPFVAPPNVPAARARLMQSAFARMVASPDFLREAKRLRVEINAIGPAEITSFLQLAYAAPPETIARAKAILGASQ